MNKVLAALFLLGLLSSRGVLGQFEDCANMLVDDADSCRDLCISVYTTPLYSFINRSGIKKCSCTVNSLAFQVCGLTTTTTTITTTTTTSPGPTTTTDFFQSNPTLEEVREHFTEILGAECSKPVKKAISEEVVSCLDDIAALELTTTGNQTLNEMYAETCANDCVHNVFGAIGNLEDKACLSALMVENDTMPNGTLEGLKSMVDIRDNLALMCTQVQDSASLYCGGLYPTLVKYETAPGTFTAEDCQEVVEYGSCLGNYIDVVEANPELLAQSFNTTNLSLGMHAYCSSQNVTGVLSASAGSEAPSTFSSASGVTAMLGSVLALAIGTALLA